jgi:hypothetical protein
MCERELVIETSNMGATRAMAAASLKRWLALLLLLLAGFPRYALAIFCEPESCCAPDSYKPGRAPPCCIQRSKFEPSDT